VAGLMAAVFILLLGIFDLGQIVNFIPTSVVAGFTSGIALIIFIGQIDNLLGVRTPAAENAVMKVLGYQQLDPGTINLTALGIAVVVIIIMLLWPKRWALRLPASLLGLMVALALTLLFNPAVPQIGEIPQTIVLQDRLLPQNIPWQHLGDLIAPALSIAALGAIESLLCGTVAGKMSGQRFHAGTELIAQGIGNLIIPFFGGVPATAAIARTSVAIKSGGRTRLVSITHSVMLLAAALALGPLLARIPMAALAGVLTVTAWRMNDWREIRDTFGRRFKSAIAAFTITMLATVALDLTQAIVIGLALSALIFVVQISRGSVIVRPVSAEKMKQDNYIMQSDASRMAVVYVIGPLFFGTSTLFNHALEDLRDYQDVILSLRTVPMVDTTGIAAIEQLIERVEQRGGHVYLSGLNEPVQHYFERSHILEHIGAERVTWSAYEAIVAADHFRAAPPPPGKA
jgi:SulP family sulfate permease